MKNWRFAKTDCSPIGLEIGYRTIRLLQISLDDPPRLVAVASADLPAELDNQPTEREALIAAKLNELIKAGDFKGRRVAMAIPPTRMHLQHLRLWRSDEGKGDAQVVAELRKRLGIDPARLVIRSVEVGEVIIDGTTQREVICMATGRNIVMSQVALAAKAKLNVVGVHDQPLAITTAFKHMFRRDGDELRTTCFIDIGASLSKVMILHGKEMVFAKMIQVTADQLAQSAAPIDESQKPERMTAQPTGEPARGIAANGGSADDTASVLVDDRRATSGQMPGLAELDMQPAAPRAHSEMLECLIDELQLCVGYHRSLYPDRPIDRLVFLGGGSQNHDACRGIAAALNVRADLGDPLSRLTRATDAGQPVGVDLRQRQGAWACPLGLCLLPADL